MAKLVEYFEVRGGGEMCAHTCTAEIARRYAAEAEVVFACLVGLCDGIPTVVESLKGDCLSHPVEHRAAVEQAQYLFGDE